MSKFPMTRSSFASKTDEFSSKAKWSGSISAPRRSVRVTQKIKDAFKRSAEIDSNAISVESADGKVILKGKVRSWAERRDAENAAWSAMGVTQVDDRLAVSL